MTTRFLPELLFEAGFTDLVSVIPPGAQLAPTSTITPSSVGKVPGRKNANGTWGGYDWRKHDATLDDVRSWCLAGANVGLRADRYPCLDIDVLDESLAQIIETAALAILGPAPIRTGRAPKRLLVYRTQEPFSKMQLMIQHESGKHLVEILGQGQQFVIHGVHPGTMRSYTWDRDIIAEGGAYALTVITREQAVAFFNELEETLTMLSLGAVTRKGDGHNVERGHIDQSGLLAPSIEILQEAVDKIPNSDDLFPSRDDYVRMGYAIKAAGGDAEEEAYNVFASWAGRHRGSTRVAGNPDTWRGDWRRMVPPYSLGWAWIAEQARPHGFADAQNEFEVSTVRPEDVEVEAPDLSDHWLAEQVASKLRSTVRYAPEQARWYVWESAVWQPDAELLAEDRIKRELRTIADGVARRGASDKEKREMRSAAQAICSNGKLSAVMNLVKSDRSIAVAIAVLDHDVWILNTPGGIVDLKTGEVRASDPDALCTKMTAVRVDAGGQCPEWRRFLREATGNDLETVAYLQRLAGYALTGSTREQQLSFIWGPGGNGKSVFANVLSGILGDYARVATMDTFTASHGDRHSTDVAMLIGARLVTASETAAGKRWDEQRVKYLTGGEHVSARFMRQDNVTFLPQFKLIFIGNHKPEIRNVDKAFRRRIQMIPFTITPAVVDNELGAKLRAEWPAILAWMIQGCLAWQQQGLCPPERVRVATAEYLDGEDRVGKWVEDCIEPAEGVNTTLHDMYASFREWANECGEWPGTQKGLSSALMTRGWEKWKEPKTRRAGFANVKIVHRQDPLLP